MSERCIDLFNIAVLYAFRFQKSPKDLVGCSRIYVVCSKQYKALSTSTVFAHQILDGRNGLLIWRCAGIENVAFQFFAFILDRVEQQAIEFFEYRQYRF